MRLIILFVLLLAFGLVVGLQKKEEFYSAGIHTWPTAITTTVHYPPLAATAWQYRQENKSRLIDLDKQVLWCENGGNILRDIRVNCWKVMQEKKRTERKKR